MSPQGDGRGLCGQMAVRSNKDYLWVPACGTTSRANRPQSAMLLTTDSWLNRSSLAAQITFSDTFSVRLQLLERSAAPIFQLCQPEFHCFKSMTSDRCSGACWKKCLDGELGKGTSMEIMCLPPFLHSGLESLFTSYHINNVQGGNYPE